MSKRVGNTTYTLVEEEPVPTLDCLDGCIYIDNEDFTKSEHFCFGIGPHSHECLPAGEGTAVLSKNWLNLTALRKQTHMFEKC
jgi:hypothetical protein